MKRLLLFILIALCISFRVFAYDPDTVGTSVPLDTAKQTFLRMKVIRSDDIISNSFSVIVEIENKSQKVLSLDTLQIYAPPRLEYYYKIPSAGRQEIKGRSKVVLQLPFIRTEQGSDMLSANKISFLPGEYELTFVIKYSDAMVGLTPKNPQVFNDVLRLTFKPPLSSLLAGGVIGSLLLALFYLISKVKADVNLKNFDFKSLKYPATYAIIIFVFGGVASLIIILIIQRVSDFTLPISIKIEDYLGGIIIGMLSTKAGESLQDFLLKRDEKGKV